MELTQVYTDHEADALPQAAPRIGLDSSKRFSPEAQATSATNRVTRAIARRCWPDLLTAWPALLAVCGVRLMPLAVDLQGRADWFKVMAAVDIALENADTPAAFIHWRNADTAIRGLAAEKAEFLRREAEREQGGEDWAKVDLERRESIVRTYIQASQMGAFAAGRL